MAQDPVIYSSNLQTGLVINAPILQNPKLQEGVVVITAATTLNANDHAGRLMVFNVAAGVTVTLPAATGTGNRYRFCVNTTVTSVADIVAVVGNDSFFGNIISSADGGNTVNGWEAGTDADQISLNGTTTGGIAGDYVEVTDVATDRWLAWGITQSSGTEATPFLTGQVA